MLTRFQQETILADTELGGLYARYDQLKIALMNEILVIYLFTNLKKNSRFSSSALLFSLVNPLYLYNTPHSN